MFFFLDINSATACYLFQLHFDIYCHPSLDLGQDYQKSKDWRLGIKLQGYPHSAIQLWKQTIENEICFSALI